MVFPINVPLITREIKQFILNDTEPTPEDGYEIVLVKNLGWTKLWMEFKVS